MQEKFISLGGIIVSIIIIIFAFTYDIDTKANDDANKQVNEKTGLSDLNK